MLQRCVSLGSIFNFMLWQRCAYWLASGRFGKEHVLAGDVINSPEKLQPLSSQIQLDNYERMLKRSLEQRSVAWNMNCQQFILANV